MKIVTKEVQTEGLSEFLGKSITLFCGVYIYTGELMDLNETCCKLTGARIVYETGDFATTVWKDAQALPRGEWYVMLHAIESFGYMKD